MPSPLAWKATAKATRASLRHSTRSCWGSSLTWNKGAAADLTHTRGTRNIQVKHKDIYLYSIIIEVNIYTVRCTYIVTRFYENQLKSFFKPFSPHHCVMFLLFRSAPVCLLLLLLRLCHTHTKQMSQTTWSHTTPSQATFVNTDIVTYNLSTHNSVPHTQHCHTHTHTPALSHTTLSHTQS